MRALIGQRTGDLIREHTAAGLDKARTDQTAVYQHALPRHSGDKAYCWDEMSGHEQRSEMSLPPPDHLTPGPLASIYSSTGHSVII